MSATINKEEIVCKFVAGKALLNPNLVETQDIWEVFFFSLAFPVFNNAHLKWYWSSCALCEREICINLEECVDTLRVCPHFRRYFEIFSLTSSSQKTRPIIHNLELIPFCGLDSVLETNCAREIELASHENADTLICFNEFQRVITLEFIISSHPYAHNQEEETHDYEFGATMHCL